MSNVIDWSKYGRGKKPEKPSYEITYHGDGERIWCTAMFPIERFDKVQDQIKTQIDYWKDEHK
ncbi:hypothetical protein PQR75_26230 [Paraburkholderia fungorum]|uniref:hypothetical protein n=1 Tax=Paraburkholderia fungorum TaxID=134537 RepID=UPI0038BA9BE6